MSLNTLLESMGTVEQHQAKLGISEERVQKILPALRKMIAYFREYPDIFVDFIKGPDCNFKFYFYQRV